uniref:Uncharacterized protein n=1 Tax=Glossina pallidipes TaxID=7398 RepID=A0A1A9Z6D9_GLOPL
MSEGLKTLLEAAQYIEQQEKLKLSPLSASAVPAALLNSDQQSRFIVHAYDAATTNGHLINNNNNSTSHSTVNHSINIRNSNIRHVGLGGGNAGTATTTTTTLQLKHLVIDIEDFIGDGHITEEIAAIMPKI